MRPSSRTVPGTGLSPWPFGLLIALSVALFLFWDGPLWAAKREASHVGRFVVSYFAVIPVAALLLLRARALTGSHLTAATGSVWGIKLVITSALYFWLARGTGVLPAAPYASAPPRAPAAAAPAATQDYRSAQGEFNRGDLRGEVVRGGAPVPGALVLVDRPLPGLPLPPASEPVRLTISDSRYHGEIYLGRSDQSFEVVSRDAVLHTLHLYDRGRAVSNVPVPSGGAPRPFPAPEPGIYDLRCDTHETERATLVVVDHPYVTRAGERGELLLSGVAEGPVKLLLVTAGEGGAGRRVRRVTARVEASETTVVHIDLLAPEVEEERL